MQIYQDYQNLFGNQMNWGKKPLLLVVDFMRAYVEPSGPFYAEAVVGAVENTKGLLQSFRKSGLPVIFTKVEYNPKIVNDGGLFTEKIPTLKQLNPQTGWSNLCSSMEVRENEIVLTKKYASSFFGTELASILRNADIDTLVIAGCSTSGCVRASVVDALQLGFRPFVVDSCVGDRNLEAHRSALIDMQSKYGEVVCLEQVHQFLDKTIKGKQL